MNAHVPSWVLSAAIIVVAIVAGQLVIASSKRKRAAAGQYGASGQYGQYLAGGYAPPAPDLTSTFEITRPRAATIASTIMFVVMGAMMIGIGLLVGGDIASMMRVQLGSASFVLGPQHILTLIGVSVIVLAVWLGINGSRWRLRVGTGGLELNNGRSCAYAELTKVTFMASYGNVFATLAGPGGKRFATVQTTWPGADVLLARLRALRPDLFVG